MNISYKWPLLALLLLISTLAFGQFPILSFDDLDKQVDDRAVDRYFYKGEPFVGTVRESDEEVKKIEELYFENGYLQKHKGWDFDGNLVRDYSFKDGLAHGKLMMFYGDGQKYFEENYIDGMIHGKQYGWYANGNIRLESEYINGVKLWQKKYDPPVSRK